MKKNYDWRWNAKFTLLQKLFRIMKITTFLILISISCVFAGKTYSQTKGLNLNLKNSTIKEVLKNIEEQSDFCFMYSEKLVNVNRKVSINIKNKKINEVLDNLFVGSNVNYKIRNRFILLTKSGNNNMTQQKKTISGKVTDSSGEPLPGVTVVIKGTTSGTITDSDGNYNLAEVPGGATLLFSFVGMRSQGIAVVGKSMINVKMQAEAVGIEEVVAIGYGVQKKVNLTGAVDVVSGKELEARPASNVSLLLQGTSPNLNISLNSMGGEPGAAQKMQIRGIGSISGNSSPLILVDGVEMAINLIDPESIENISVLKDASSCAIYGSRAAFGVVLITTKSGTNQPIKIEYTNNLSIVNPIYVPSMESSLVYATAFNQTMANSNLGPKFPQEQVDRIAGYIDGTYTNEYDVNNPPTSLWRGRHNGNANYNWTKEYYKSQSFHQKHNINISGGDGKTQYYFTTGLYDEPGLYSWGDDGYKRYNVLANIKSQITDWISFNFNTKYARTETDNPIGMVGLSRTYTWSQFIDFWPTMPKYNIDGTIANPLIQVLENGGRIKNQQHDLWMNAGIELEPIKGWKTNIKYNYNTRWGSETENPIPVPVPLPNGKFGNIGSSQSGYEETLNHGQYTLFSLYSSFEKTIGKHYFKALAGYEQDTDFNRGLYGTKMELITTDVPSISTALGDYTVDDWINHWSTQAVFGRLNYNFDEKYLIEFSARYDGSSRFAKGSRWGFFPSVSAGYNIAKENFWSSIEPYINTLKIRASYGSLGNQNVSNYLYLSRIPVAYRRNTSSYSNPGYILDDEVPLYAGTPNLISNELTWETITTLDFGIDAEFINHRLNMGFDWYNRKTHDMLGPSETLPSVLGTSVPLRNNAELSTKGFELSISWKDRISSDLSYDARFTLGDSQTTILKYFNENGLIDKWYEGKKYGEIWGLTTDGIIQTEGEKMSDQSLYFATWGPGDIKYKDLNNDDIIDEGSRTLDDHGDLSIIGNSTPRFNFSFSGGINWKNFDFNMLWQGIGKREIAPKSSSEYFWGLNSGTNNSALLKDGPALDYWRPADETNILGPNTDSYFPKPYFSNERNKNIRTQSKYILNAAYLRLKNLQVGYTIPKDILEKTFIGHARIYFSGENLLTFSKLPKLFEPETFVSSNPSDGGVDLGEIYPITRMFSFGVSLTF